MTNLKKCVLFLNLIFFSFFVLALSSCDSEIGCNIILYISVVSG